jgi:uncharacterized repeat protein (TIGR01451 family)
MQPPTTFGNLNDMLIHDTIRLPNAKTSGKLFARAILAALGLSCGALQPGASAQTCLKCPDNANDTAIGTAFGVFVTRNGVEINVSGKVVGSCEPLVLKANVSYNSFGINNGIGAGFTGGTGRILFPNGTSLDVTPADMATTLVGPAPCGTVAVKQMNNATYTLTPADITAGLATFTFQFTNGTSLLPNSLGDCVLKVSASPQQTVTVAPVPTCTVNPPTNSVCATFSTSFTVTPTGAGPFTYNWSGPAGFSSTNATITITNAQAANAGVYTVIVTDIYGCVTSCSGTLIVNPNAPNIKVTKICPPNPVQPGGTINFTGTVTNTGDVTLTNVFVVNDQPAPNTVLLGPITLVAGAGTSFGGTYTVPIDSCGPYTDTLTARGTSVCGISTTNTDTKSCAGTNSPAIIVSKSCPQGLFQPGQLLTISGTVTNIGNITLTNVTVTNTIAALGGGGRQILGPLTLAPGAGTNFTDSYTVPLDSCGPYRDTVLASGTDKCFGHIVTSTDFEDCPGTNSPSLVVTKDCPPGRIQPGELLTIFGTITNNGNITLTNVTVTNIIGALGNTNRQVFGPVNLPPGAGMTFTDSYIIPLDSCGPYRDTMIAMGSDKCFGRIVTATDFKDCFGTNSPAIVVTKNCPPGLLQPGQTLNITGTVTNTGNITLTNVTVTNTIAAISAIRRVLGPITLAPGAGTTFNDSYVVPLDSCGPYRDTVLASGADKCFGRVVTSIDTEDCPGTNSPAITVSKSCPPNPVPPGGIMVISGVVSNAGNITLTNVTVTNVIAAIGQTHTVLGPINLPPGTSLPFTDSYVVPLNSCGPFRDTITAQGYDKCLGRLFTASDTKDCPVITIPKIAVTKRCPANPVVPGGIAIFSGTVSNAGNIALTNVTVVNNRPTNNTPVLGPVSLLPGQSISFTGSEAVPPNCCEYFDTLTAVGASICTGSNVMASASAACPTLVLPQISVTKSCPPAPVPLGHLLVFTGTVSNSGNIALINVTVVGNQPSNNTPVIGPLTLAPGETANFSGSYAVPINICDTNISDIVTARGTDVCAGSNVTATAGALCPIVPTPRLTVTKQCPANPVAPGQLLVFTGTVSNSGSITITNITVVNDRPSPNTIVLGQPTTLVPGQSTSFSGSYIAPYDCCGPCVDTLTARGNEVCAGSNVVGTASAACPRITTPAISVTRDCPPAPVMQGELVFITGIVSNSGNATLGNVTIIDDQAGNVLDNLVLAPGEAVPYFGMYIPTNCGPALPAAVTATGNDICTEVVVSNRFVTGCEVLCPEAAPLVLFNAKVEAGKFVFSFMTELNHSYLIQYTDTLNPVNWLPLGSPVSGTGGGMTVNDTLTVGQRFYRVQLQ